MSLNHLEEQKKQQERWQREALDIDKEDLLGLLTLRFGNLPQAVTDAITASTESQTIERLILVAANVPTWEAFLEELNATGPSFRIVGSQYQPF